MKHLIRDQVKSQRNLLPGEEISKKSNVIKSKLFALPEYKKAKLVLFYVSFGSEVDTHDMIQETLESKRVAVPKFTDDGLHLSEIESFDELELGGYDILEPKELKEIENKEVDLIVVPGVAFDKRGHRIGFGQGHYDTLLPNFPKVPKFALAFKMQIVEKVPDDEWDVKMDKVISE